MLRFVPIFHFHFSSFHETFIIVYLISNLRPPFQMLSMRGNPLAQQVKSILCSATGEDPHWFQIFCKKTVTFLNFNLLNSGKGTCFRQLRYSKSLVVIH